MAARALPTLDLAPSEAPPLDEDPRFGAKFPVQRRGAWEGGIIDLILEGSRKDAPIVFHGDKRFSYFEVPGVSRFEEVLSFWLTPTGRAFIVTTEAVFEWHVEAAARTQITALQRGDWFVGCVALSDDEILLASEKRLVRMRRKETWEEADQVKLKRARRLVFGCVARGRVILILAASGVTSTLFAVGEALTPIGMLAETFLHGRVVDGQLFVEAQTGWSRVEVPAPEAEAARPQKAAKKSKHPLQAARVELSVLPARDVDRAFSHGDRTLMSGATLRIENPYGGLPRRMILTTPSGEVRFTIPGLAVEVNEALTEAWAVNRTELSSADPQALSRLPLATPAGPWETIAMLGGNRIEDLALIDAGHLVLKTTTLAANAPGTLDAFDLASRRVVSRVEVPKSAVVLAWPKHGCLACLTKQLDLFALDGDALIKVATAKLPDPTHGLAPRFQDPMRLALDGDGALLIIDPTSTGRTIRVSLRA